MIKLNGYEVEFEKFPNGELKPVNIHEVLLQNINCENYVFDFKFESHDDLLKLYFLKKHFDAKVLKYQIAQLIIQYMPYSRMDRVENNSMFTLKFISEFINNLNFDSVIVTEPHSNVTLGTLNNAYGEYITQKSVQSLLLEFNMTDDDYIMFPDNGAAQRYKHIKHKNVLVGNKVRDFDTGEIKSLDIIGNVINPNKVLIIDDLSSYGGTFVNASKKLRELGFSEVNLYVTHAENSIFKGELFNHIDKLITTDSILSEQDNWENRKYANQLKIVDFFSLHKGEI